jgi:class 3 adenylate cyclase
MGQRAGRLVHRGVSRHRRAARGRRGGVPRSSRPGSSRAHCVDDLEARGVQREQHAARGEPALAFGIGLHLGDVLYGHIGTPERIEFSVIGAAANEAARIEALCKTLGRSLLVSQALARHPTARGASSARTHLRGIGEPIELLSAPEL